MGETTELGEIARSFAAALDACDFATASACLASDCRYDGPRGICFGPQAIIESYRESDARARRDFDSVGYRSETIAEGHDSVRLTYFDEIHYGSATYTYRCCQLLRFNQQGRIEHIEHVELPNERNRLREFCKSCGIQWE